jgi:hypothetical protein
MDKQRQIVASSISNTKKEINAVQEEKMPLVYAIRVVNQNILACQNKIKETWKELILLKTNQNELNEAKK